MRSRYSAFVKDLRPYLLATWHPDTRPAEIEAPEPGLQWLGWTCAGPRSPMPTTGWSSLWHAASWAGGPTVCTRSAPLCAKAVAGCTCAPRTEPLIPGVERDPAGLPLATRNRARLIVARPSTRARRPPCSSNSTLIQMAMVAVGLAALGIITVEGVLISRRRGGEPYDWAAFWTTVRINLWRVVVESLPMGAVLGVALPFGAWMYAHRLWTVPMDTAWAGRRCFFLHGVFLLLDDIARVTGCAGTGPRTRCTTRATSTT